MAEELPFRAAPRKRALVLVAVGAGIVALLVAGRFAMRASHERQAKVALASLHQCLFGPPLEQGEHPSGRLHRIALGDPPGEWPSRCDRYVRDLAEARADVGGSQSNPLQAQMPDHFDVVDIEGSPYNFDAFFEVTAPRPTEKAPSDVHSAPSVGKVAIADYRTRPIVAGADLIDVSSDPVPGADVHVLLSGPRLCTARAPLDTIACAPLSPSTTPRRAKLWPGSEPGGPVLLATPSWWMGAHEPIVRADSGERFCAFERRACIAYGMSDGQVAFVTRTAPPTGEDDVRVHYFVGRGSKGDAPQTDLKLDIPSSVEVQLIGERLFFLQSKEPGHWRLMSRTVGPPLGPVDDLGEVPHEHHVAACYTKNALAIHGKGFVTFFERNEHGPVHRFDFPESESTTSERIVGCGADDFHITETSQKDNKGFLVRSLRCTKAGCGAVEDLDVDAMLAKDADAKKKPLRNHLDVHATRMGDKLLVLWRSASRGLRFRIAPPKDLAQAPEHVLYDDRITEGQPSGMSLLQDTVLLLPRHDATLFFVDAMGSNGGIKAFRIGPDGAYTSLQ